ERPIGDAVAVRQASAADHSRFRRRSFDPGEELLRQAALPDARVPVHGDEVRTTVRLDAPEDAVEELELTFPADDRRAEAGDAALGGHRPLAGDTECVNSLGLPPQLELTKVLEAEPADGARRPLADDDRAGLGSALEPSGGVHRIARHHRLAGF